MAKAQMNLKVVTPERILFEGDVNEFVIDTKSGQITVFPNHQAMVTILKAGEALIRTEQEEKPLVLSGGVLEVAQNRAVILADTAEHINELDMDRAKKAMELAEKLITEKKFEPHEYEALQANLAKHKSRYTAATKWRK